MQRCTAHGDRLVACRHSAKLLSTTFVLASIALALVRKVAQG